LIKYGYIWWKQVGAAALDSPETETEAHANLARPVLALPHPTHRPISPDAGYRPLPSAIPAHRSLPYPDGRRRRSPLSPQPRPSSASPASPATSRPHFPTVRRRPEWSSPCRHRGCRVPGPCLRRSVLVPFTVGCLNPLTRILILPILKIKITSFLCRQPEKRGGMRC
jgi:hypothetical protein